MSLLREHGIDDLEDVKAVFIEGSGHVSVIPNSDKNGKDVEDDRRKRKIG